SASSRYAESWLPVPSAWKVSPLTVQLAPAVASSVTSQSTAPSPVGPVVLALTAIGAPGPLSVTRIATAPTSKPGVPDNPGAGNPDIAAPSALGVAAETKH